MHRVARLLPACVPLGQLVLLAASKPVHASFRRRGVLWADLMRRSFGFEVHAYARPTVSLSVSGT